MSNDNWDHSADIVVVGSGAGALTAALVAAIDGASVLIVEKCRRLEWTRTRSRALAPGLARLRLGW